MSEEEKTPAPEPKGTAEQVDAIPVDAIPEAERETLGELIARKVSEGMEKLRDEMTHAAATAPASAPAPASDTAKNLFADLNKMIGKYHSFMPLGFLKELDALAAKYFPKG